MPRARKPWTKPIEHAGVAVRLYERGGSIYREVRLGEGKKDRKSLHTADRAHAEQLARALARDVANLRHVGQVGPLTWGQLFARYAAEQLPTLSAARQRTVRGMLALLGQHFADGARVDDCSQPRVDAYVTARRTGAIRSPRHRARDPGARAGTIRNELALLRTIVRWGRETRVDGRPLVSGDPMLGVDLPQEANARRPVTTEARYQATLADAEAADGRGRFRCLLVLARHTGRRINALCQLRASDVLRARAQLEAALGAVGQPVGHAAHWPHGGLHFRAEHDKRGYAAVVPINAEARAALDAYLRAHPRVGDAPLFPATGDDAAPVRKVMAGYWLKRAEALAGLPPLERGGWHAYRRQWATERRHLPPQDLMAAGGWRSVQTLQRAYQHADAATTYAVVALTPPGQPSARPSTAPLPGRPATADA